MYVTFHDGLTEAFGQCCAVSSIKIRTRLFMSALTLSLFTPGVTCTCVLSGHLRSYFTSPLYMQINKLICFCFAKPCSGVFRTGGPTALVISDRPQNMCFLRDIHIFT